MGGGGGDVFAVDPTLEKEEVSRVHKEKKQTISRIQ